MNENAVGIIFRVPEKGKVKKRLESFIGVEKTFFYYKKMLDETIEKFLSLENVDLYGFFKGNVEKLNYKIALIEQKDGDLGEIILDSVLRIKERGYKRIIIVGSDSPDLPIDFISLAFRYLDDFDIVVGPAYDGGFYLLGCKNKLDEKIFENIEWGNENVYKRLLANLKKYGISFYSLPYWYDIDDLESLNKWLKRSEFASS